MYTRETLINTCILYSVREYGLYIFLTDFLGDYIGSSAPTATAEFINLGKDSWVPPSASPDSKLTFSTLPH